MTKKLHVGQGRYDPHTYRGRDVTGALDFVRTLMVDLWDMMPKDERPTCDREATAFFFRIDRSNANMEEFLGFLAAHNETLRKKLRKSQRKSPKRASKKARK